MSTVYTVYQWLIISQQVIHLSKRWLSYGHVPSRTAGCKKPMRCLRKQDDISGCETKTLRCWYLLSFPHLMVMVGFLKTHTTKCQASVKAKSTYQNSAGLPDCSRPKPANNSFKKTVSITVIPLNKYHGNGNTPRPVMLFRPQVPSKGFLRLQSSVKIHKESTGNTNWISHFFLIPEMNSEPSQMSLQISELPPRLGKIGDPHSVSENCKHGHVLEGARLQQLNLGHSNLYTPK